MTARALDQQNITMVYYFENWINYLLEHFYEYYCLKSIININTFGCMLLSYQVRVSEWIYTLCSPYKYISTHNTVQSFGQFGYMVERLITNHGKKLCVRMLLLPLNWILVGILFWISF